jgi:hypothetical protein
LGTGSAAPAVSDTTLQTPGAASTTIQRNFVSVAPYVAGPPEYLTDFMTFRFATGVATGTWTEVGITNGSAPFVLFSRALMLNGGGTPTAVTVLADESLDVTYTLRLYPPGDSTGSITLNGTSYDYTLRPSFLGNSSIWAFNYIMSGQLAAVSGGAAAQAVWFSGAIGSSTSGPSSQVGSNSIKSTPQAYVSGSRQRTFELEWALNDANVGGGFRSLRFDSTSGGSMLPWQIGFTPNVPKLNTQILRLSFTLSMARRP